MSVLAQREPEQFSEDEAARRLTISKSTLVRERLAGRIFPIRMGARIIRYTDAILEEYKCRCRNAPDRLATSGSASAPDRPSGAERGTTPPLDRQSAHRLAQTIFKRGS